MGKYDSSLTRVQPVFTTLLNRDPSGESWLPILFDLASQSTTHVKASLGHIGKIIPNEGGYFEIPVPPSGQFLTWLVKNPDKMKWPLQRGQKKNSATPLKIGVKNCLVYMEKKTNVSY
jgi:hypothetical protein